MLEVEFDSLNVRGLVLYYKFIKLAIYKLVNGRVDKEAFPCFGKWFEWFVDGKRLFHSSLSLSPPPHVLLIIWWSSAFLAEEKLRNFSWEAKKVDELGRCLVNYLVKYSLVTWRNTAWLLELGTTCLSSKLCSRCRIEDKFRSLYIFIYTRVGQSERGLELGTKKIQLKWKNIYTK